MKAMNMLTMRLVCAVVLIFALQMPNAVADPADWGADLEIYFWWPDSDIEFANGTG